MQVSLHAAPALLTLLAERGRATAHTWLWPHLHHTRLKPRHRHPVGECTSPCRHCRHLPALLTRLAKLSGEARPDGRQRAFAQGDVAQALHPYPPQYSVAFASSILPFPPVYRLALRRTFPRGRRTGVPCSVSVTTHGVGALCPPGAWDAHDKEARSPCTRSSALLAQAFQPLWLVVCDDVYRAFTWVRHTIHPSPVAVSVLTDTPSPHGCDVSLATGGALSGGPVQVVTFLPISVGYRCWDSGLCHGITPSTTRTTTTSCRSLPAEPNVKVSLHAAQASQRPCDGPVSSQPPAGSTILDRRRCPYGEGSTSGTRPPPFATPSIPIPPWFSCRDTAGQSARLRGG